MTYEIRHPATGNRIATTDDPESAEEIREAGLFIVTESEQE